MVAQAGDVTGFLPRRVKGIWLNMKGGFFMVAQAAAMSRAFFHEESKASG